MEIQVVSGINFAGRPQRRNVKKQHPEHNNQTQPLPTSPNANAAMRNMMLGLMALGAATGAGTMQSCTEDDVLASASASASANASAVVVGGNCHHHDTVTVIKPDTIYLPGDTIILPGDTVIHTEIKPVYVKDYPFHLGDSLIEQGKNINIPIDGPEPDGSGLDSVVYVGSKAHNRYDNKFYESMVDSTGTNKRELSVVTKVLDLYNSENPKTSYMKTIITDVPGRGIKLTRYVANTDKKPEDNEEYLWNYAGYEVRSNGKNGYRNTRSIFDNNNNLIYQGDYQKGEEPGTFLYGSIIYNEETGEPYYDENGNPEFAQYDFDQAVIYSDYAKVSDDYRHPGWQYQ